MNLLARKKLEGFEEKCLASYAIKSAASKGREYKEKEDNSRTCFQLDRDRIIHSKAFRRLSGKTQVFVATYGDHFRDRLSHTLETAQIGRDISRMLGLNEDLVEAIALSHDLGHTPFGHAGEAVLDSIMEKFGLGFEHNEQSKRIVEKLEDRYPNFPGLNLTFEVREGLSKHQTHYDQRGKKISGKFLEAQAADIADEIAYCSHDIDDGLREKLFFIENLRQLALWRDAENASFKEYGKGIGVKYLRHRAISALINMMIEDACKESLKRIKEWKIRSPRDALKRGKNTISFSIGFKKKLDRLQKFLWKKMYNSSRIRRHARFRGRVRKSEAVIKFLFFKFYKNPGLLPGKLQAKIDVLDLKEVIVKDFIAGMTDSYALNLYKSLRTKRSNNIPTYEMPKMQI